MIVAIKNPFALALLVNYMLLLEFVAVAFIFFRYFKKREHFGVRLGVGILGMILAGLAPAMTYWYIGRYYPAGTVLLYILMLVIIYGFMRLCFDEKPKTILFCALAAYAMQVITNRTFNLVKVAAGFGNLMHTNLLLYYFWEIVVYGIVFAILAPLFSKKIHLFVKSNVGSDRLIVVTTMAVLTMNILCAFSERHAEESTALSITCYAFAIFCGFFVLLVLSGMTENSMLSQELQTIHSIRQKEKSQYAVSKENMELLNMKCHDLKHQLNLLRSGERDHAKLEQIQKIEDVIEIYDQSVESNNAALNVVLTEKKIYCEQHGILLSCMADGAKMSFISETDLYSLFGNILDNAIEAVMKIPDRERRVISLVVKEEMGCLLISLDNCFEGTIEFVNGLPKTTKGDERFHGYGMKSIRYVVEKYGGCMDVHADEESFHLNIAIPLR